MEDKCLPLRRNIVTGLFLKNITSQVSSIKIYILMRSVQILPITRISMVGGMILISSEIQCFFLRKSAERVWNTLLFKKLHKKKRSAKSVSCLVPKVSASCLSVVSRFVNPTVKEMYQLHPKDCASCVSYRDTTKSLTLPPSHPQKYRDTTHPLIFRHFWRPHISAVHDIS